MKFEEKMKKNQNCEISHIVRPEVTPEVYNQKQNTLLISECVEYRRFKVTWAGLWVYSDGYTDECIRAYGRPSEFERMHGRVHVSCTARRFETHDLDGPVAPLFVAHDMDECAARRFVTLGLDIRCARLGRDASTVRSRRTDWLHTG